MKISELSQRSAVPVATIKYYLREGLLFPGRLTAPNQALYADNHLHRIRLVRVLLEVGKLSIAEVKRVLSALEDPTQSLHEVLGVAHHALAPPPEADDSPEAATSAGDVDRWLAGLGWHTSESAPARGALARALTALRRLGNDAGAEVFTPYARLANSLAAFELETLAPTPSGGDLEGRAAAIEGAVVGTVIFEAALVALRRLAQEHHSAGRLGEPRGLRREDASRSVD